jgi:hypothetical protein
MCPTEDVGSTYGAAAGHQHQYFGTLVAVIQGGVHR